MIIPVISRRKFLLAGVFLLLGFIFFQVGQAALSDIEFPIPELGNCGNKDECRAYCDDFSHKNECLGFAKKHGLLAEEEIEKVADIPDTGPGGCKGESACRVYCEAPDHLEECIQFAVDHGFMSQKEADEILKQARKQGPGGCRGEECRSYCDDPANRTECLEYACSEGRVPERECNIARRVLDQGGPGQCRSEEECRNYCNDPDHLDECLTFAESQGFVASEEAVRIRKSGLTSGPGGCKFDECRAYCEDPAHQNECIDFGEKHGLMVPEQAAIARKMAGKTGPGGCRGEECRAYCEDQSHAKECLDFALQEGLIPPEEAKRAQKFLAIAQEGGPGGCKGMACRDYCDDPAHQDECFSFAKDKGLIPPEHVAEFEAGVKIHKKMQSSGGPGGCRTDEVCQAYCSEPSHTEECVAFAAAHGGISDEEARRMLKEFSEGRLRGHGDFAPSGDFKNFEEETRKRFEEFRQLETHFRGGFPEGFKPPEGSLPPGSVPPPGGLGGGVDFSGPGGCRTPDECIKYCIEHKEECFHFGPSGGPAGFAPHPGGDYPQIRSHLAQPASFMTLRKNPDGRYDLLVVDADGIKEFSLTPDQGSRYAGGVSGCPREYKTNVAFSSSDFPMAAYMIDCKDNRFEATFTYEQVSSTGGFVPPSDVMPPPGGYPGHEGSDFFKGIGPVPGTNGLFSPIEGTVPGTYPPPPDVKSPYCPKMPTVEQCPSGSRKEVVFSSPECGVYYGCTPDHEIQGSPYPSGDPKHACYEKGGTWDGSACQFPSRDATYDQERMCAEKGGKWDGSTCIFSNQQQSRARKGFLATLIEFLFGW